MSTGTNTVGPLVKRWRSVRRVSQLDLALEVGVSARHLSFVETGRSRPSPELVLALADGLDVPHGQRNQLLLAAGHAPRYSRTPLDAAEMALVRASLQRMLDAHDPYPGVAIDQRWDVVLANDSAGLFLEGVAPDLFGPPMNVFRVCLHPDGLAARTVNLDEWASYLVGQLDQLVATTQDDELRALRDEVADYPACRDLDRSIPDPSRHDLLVPVQLELGGQTLSLFTTLTRFGTPVDITLAELAVELFYPADPASEQVLRSLAGDEDR